MNKIIKFIGLFTILLVSFYYTEKLSVLVMENNVLIQEIKNKSNDYSVSAFSAKIDGDYITPGLNGYKVNVLKSYDNMKEINFFDSIFLEYDKILPKISINNNKDKIINKGNSKKGMVTLLLYNNEEAIKYMENLEITFSRVVNIKTFKSDAKYEQINGEIKNFQKMEYILTKYNLNKDICTLNYSNLSLCKKKQKFLVEPTVIFTNSNFLNIKKNIDSGMIIFIEDNVTETNLKLLLKQIKYENLKFSYLSDLISEEVNYN